MIKIKNTNDHDVDITVKNVIFRIPAFGIMEVNEVVMYNLPEGVVKAEEVLTEIDPYTNKTVSESPVDTSRLLNEGK